jgi:hypothetical protein
MSDGGDNKRWIKIALKCYISPDRAFFEAVIVNRLSRSITFSHIMSEPTAFSKAITGTHHL